MPGRTPIVSTQVEYSLLARDAERELLPAAEHVSAGVLAGSPLVLRRELLVRGLVERPAAEQRIRLLASSRPEAVPSGLTAGMCAVMLLSILRPKLYEEVDFPSPREQGRQQLSGRPRLPHTGGA